MTMQLTVTVGETSYHVNLRQPLDISIPVRFDGEQVSVFSAPPARREPYATQGFIGNVGQGGSCNCDTYYFSPHLNGTHTECVGHIAAFPIAVTEIWDGGFVPAMLVSITPQTAADTTETYDPPLKADDLLITRAALEQILKGSNTAFHEALVIRTAPNDAAKRMRDYSEVKPPFFSKECMHYLNELGVKHLLADVPSIDRLDDEGKLTNHHIFWNVPLGKHVMDKVDPSRKTVTEFVYVADSIMDGIYMLNLQVASFMADAAPSRPVLYKVIRL